ncbi:hypothetical protein ACFOMD_00700 [Sphingoaurantiacus capsulatus]|uniref:Tetratricopeptide repeat protein n=1 Tax=Sphingoaurantiacus capsulatus TaxID=1771310 RepID=A0ABV7X741_9SPHN
MRKFLPRLLAAALLAAAVPAVAQTAEDVARLDAVKALAERASGLAAQGQLEPALALIDEGLAVRPEPGRERGGLLYMQALLLSDLRRPAEAVTAIDAAAAMLPDRPELRLMQAQVQLRAGQAEAASRTVVYMADAFPAGLTKIDEPWLSQLLRELEGPAKEELRFDLLMALSSRGYAGRGTPGAADWMYDDAILGLLKRDRLDEAKAMAAKFVDSSALVRMLVDRRYAKLWPAIEAKAGPRAAKAIAAEVAAVEAAYRAKPQDYETVAAYLAALRGVGRVGEAVTVSTPFAADMAKVEAGGEDAFWVINEHAYALAAAGRVDEADAAFAKLLAMDLAKNPALITMAINRGSLLTSYGRPAAALAVAEWVTAKGDRATTGFGLMWVAATRACALKALDDPGATAALGMLTADPKINYPAATMALLCADRLDEAEKLVLARLEDPARRGGMLLAFQDFEQDAPGGATFRAALAAKLLAIRDRPAVRKAIARHGRILPIAARQTTWGGF